jgi:hypothetical protein
MKLWEGLEQDLNYNAMVSQRGVSTSIIRMRSATPIARRGNAMRLQRRRCRTARPRRRARAGAVPRFRQRALSHPRRPAAARGGTARHDAVAWGYARGADSAGVDIIQNCEVTGFDIERRRVDRRRDDARHRSGKKIGMAVAGNTSRVARWRAAAADREPRAAGLRLGRRSSR